MSATRTTQRRPGVAPRRAALSRPPRPLGRRHARRARHGRRAAGGGPDLPGRRRVRPRPPRDPRVLGPRRAAAELRARRHARPARLRLGRHHGRRRALERARVVLDRHAEPRRLQLRAQPAGHARLHAVVRPRGGRRRQAAPRPAAPDAAARGLHGLRRGSRHARGSRQLRPRDQGRLDLGRDVRRGRGAARRGALRAGDRGIARPAAVGARGACGRRRPRPAAGRRRRRTRGPERVTVGAHRSRAAVARGQRQQPAADAGRVRRPLALGGQLRRGRAAPPRRPGRALRTGRGAREPARDRARA